MEKDEYGRPKRAFCDFRKCKDTEIIDTKGSCAKCASYTYRFDSRTCRADTCNPNQILTTVGRC